MIGWRRWVEGKVSLVDVVFDSQPRGSGFIIYIISG